MKNEGAPSNSPHAPKNRIPRLLERPKSRQFTLVTAACYLDGLPHVRAEKVLVVPYVAELLPPYAPHAPVDERVIVQLPLVVLAVGRVLRVQQLVEVTLLPLGLPRPRGPVHDVLVCLRLPLGGVLLPQVVGGPDHHAVCRVVHRLFSKFSFSARTPSWYASRNAAEVARHILATRSGDLTSLVNPVFLRYMTILFVNSSTTMSGVPRSLRLSATAFAHPASVTGACLSAVIVVPSKDVTHCVCRDEESVCPQASLHFLVKHAEDGRLLQLVRHPVDDVAILVLRLRCLGEAEAPVCLLLKHLAPLYD